MEQIKNTCTNADADVNKKAHLIWSMCLNSNELYDSLENRNQNRFVNEINKMLIHIARGGGGEGGGVIAIDDDRKKSIFFSPPFEIWIQIFDNVLICSFFFCLRSGAGADT